MKTWKILTIIGVTLVATALVVSTAVAMGPWGSGGFGGMMGGYGGGMMGGYGNNGQYVNQPNQQYYQPVYPFQFGGMMGRMAGGYGFGGMMSSFRGMMGYGYGAPYANNGQQISIDTAETIAKNYVASINNPNLQVNQVEEYTANFYAQVTEKSTGNGAFELLINKYTGSIYPEMGPNMMWNTQYGMMRGGALGGIFGAPTTTMTVTTTQATANAQQFLTANIPGTTTGDVTTFYGYYTIEVVNGTTPYGMLSVNGYTGQIWFHNWHGAFIQELD